MSMTGEVIADLHSQIDKLRAENALLKAEGRAWRAADDECHLIGVLCHEYRVQASALTEELARACIKARAATDAANITLAGGEEKGNA